MKLDVRFSESVHSFTAKLESSNRFFETDFGQVQTATEIIGGVDFVTDETLKLENGILSVNTTNDMEQDNTLPITSAGVYTAVGNIEVLLKTI